jgi:hypothetical protein
LFSRQALQRQVFSTLLFDAITMIAIPQVRRSTTGRRR